MTANIKYSAYFILTIISTTSVFAQKRKYEGMGAVKEIVMPAQARTIGHFSLFYEATLPDDSNNLQPFWYRIAFDKDCDFKFNLFPVVESDRYDFSLFKIEGDQNFCDAVDKGKVTAYNDIKIYRTWNDSEQTQSFRSNLVFTKTVPVKKGDVIYLELIHLWGEGEGHIIDFVTCDYSYVLKAVKSEYALSKRDSATHKQLSEAQKNTLALDRIKESLCPLKGKPVQLSAIAFNEKTVNIIDKFASEGNLSNNIQPVKDKSSSKDTMSFSLEKKNEPVTLKCVLSDAYSGEFIKTPAVIIDIENQQRIYPDQLANSVNEFTLQKNKKYSLQCTAEDYYSYNLLFETNNLYSKGSDNNILSVQLEPIVIQKQKIIQVIYFYPNSVAIKPESHTEIKKLKEFLAKNPEAVIEVTGHTNGNQPIRPEKIISKNNPELIFEGSSKELSFARANKVKQQLISHGIKEDRIKIKSYGGDVPVYASTKNWEEIKKNMRVEVSLINN